MLENIKYHILSVHRIDRRPFQRKAGEYIHWLILPVLGHTLTPIRALKVNQISIACKTIVLDAAFQVAREFIRALVIGSDNSQGFLPDGTLAAGYRIGQVYEDFYADLHAAEVPADLDDEARQVYFTELKRHVAPLLRKAIEVYRKNLEMGRRVHADNEWMEKSEAGLKKLEALLATLPRPDVDGPGRTP